MEAPIINGDGESSEIYFENVVQKNTLVIAVENEDELEFTMQ